MTEWLVVAFGAALGAPLRYVADLGMQRLIAVNHPARIPVGTLTVNILGSALLGWVLARLDPSWVLFLGIGFCGAFTTFSTFVAQSDVSIREGRLAIAGVNLLANVVLCFAAFWIVWSLSGGWAGV